MTQSIQPLILVVGGTGMQGGNVARELLRHGHRVRILSRNPDGAPARAVMQLGAEVMQGDLANPQSLIPVMHGVGAIFSAQYADPKDPAAELRHTRNMVQAAADAGVEQVIHTSVVGTNIFPRWNKSALLTAVWESKYAAEELIRDGGFPSWTILHPSFFMENFTEPLAAYMAPALKQGKLFGALHPHTPIKLNSGQDTALFARAGFENPQRFANTDINIAADELSMVQIAECLSRILGKAVVYEELDAAEAIDRGLFPGTVESHHWMNEVPGWGFDLAETLSHGLPRQSFEQWLREHRSRISL